MDEQQDWWGGELAFCVFGLTRRLQWTHVQGAQAAKETNKWAQSNCLWWYSHPVKIGTRSWMDGRHERRR